MLNVLKRWLYKAYVFLRRIPHRLAKIPESPHDIAKAFAAGVFIGILPFMGTAVALVAAVVFRLSKVAAILGSLTTNPWTVGVVYAISYKIGGWILKHKDPIDWMMIVNLRTGWPQELGRIAPALIVGGVVLGLLMGFISYWIVRGLVTEYRKVRLHQHLP